MSKELTPDSLSQLLSRSQQSPSPLLLFVWGPHCAPCKALAERLRYYHKQHDLPELWRLNGEAHVNWCQQQDIRQLPELRWIERGRVVRRLSGIISDAELRAFLWPPQFTVAKVSLATDQSGGGSFTSEGGDAVSDRDIPLSIEAKVSAVTAALANGDDTQLATLLQSLSDEQSRVPEFQRARSWLALSQTRLPLSFHSSDAQSQPHNEHLAHRLHTLRDAFFELGRRQQWPQALDLLSRQLMEVSGLDTSASLMSTADPAAWSGADLEAEFEADHAGDTVVESVHRAGQAQTVDGEYDALVGLVVALLDLVPDRRAVHQWRQQHKRRLAPVRR